MTKTRVLPVTRSIRAIPGLLDAVARAIYETHVPKPRRDRDKVPTLREQNLARAPLWDSASDEVRDWVIAQAVAATRLVDEYLAKDGNDW
jgi:hypothetical protein